MLDHKQWTRIASRLLRTLFDVLDVLVHIVTWFTIKLSTKRELPEIKSELLYLSATQIATRIRNKEVRCVDLVQTYIDRIKEVQPYINGVVQDRFEEALKEAKAVDELNRENFSLVGFLDTKPLLGVPFTVKETLAVKGLSNNAARSRVESRIADKDAEAVKNLRNAGAIPLLVSNTPELCLYWETWNSKYGRTNNPYDTRRTVGGSSGGEASLIASAASVIGIGSDIAGSLRVPAFFCGIYGHKPTPGYIPIDGHIPGSPDPLWDYYFTVGPVTRYAEDIPIVLKALIGDKTKIGKLRLDSPVDISKVKILYMYGEGPEGVLQKLPGVESIKAISTAVSALQDKYGCQAVETKIKEFTDSFYMNFSILRMKGLENVFQRDDQHPDDWGVLRMLEVLLKKLTFQSTASVSCVLFGPLKCLIEAAPDNVYTLLKQKADDIKTKLTDLMGTDTVLIYPTFTHEAPFHNRMCSKILEVTYCSIFNILGMPATQCPTGLTKDGMPIGLQIAAGPHQDRLCIAVARALQKELGGWVPPGEQEKE